MFICLFVCLFELFFIDLFVYDVCVCMGWCLRRLLSTLWSVGGEGVCFFGGGGVWGVLFVMYMHGVRAYMHGVRVHASLSPLRHRHADPPTHPTPKKNNVLPPHTNSNTNTHNKQGLPLPSTGKEPPAFGAAADGDADRNMILGACVYVYIYMCVHTCISYTIYKCIYQQPPTHNTPHPPPQAGASS